MSDDQAPAPPLLRIVKGAPSDLEIAVITAVLASARGPAAAPADPRPRELWGNPSDRLRPPGPLGPSAFPNLQFGY